MIDGAHSACHSLCGIRQFALLYSDPRIPLLFLTFRAITHVTSEPALAKGLETATMTAAILRGDMTDSHYDPRYLVGVLLFNRQDYFEAHEGWEDLWSESHGPARKFYQGLIQAAVGLCHFCNGNRNGAVKLYHSSLDYLAGCPSPFLGLDLEDFKRQMEACFRDILDGQDAEIDPERLPEMRLNPEPDRWPDPADTLHDED
jgi:uncharacterized protein